MKRLQILLSLILIISVGMNAKAADKTTVNNPVIILSVNDHYDQTIKREVRELNRFKKLTDRYLRQREKGQRVSARHTLRQIASLINAEVSQTKNKYRYELRFSGEFRSGAELYRRRTSQYSKRRPDNSYRRRSDSRIIDLYRSQLIRQRSLQIEINDLISSGYYFDVVLADKIISFEQTLRDEVQLLTGSAGRISTRR
ncbi:hypothetical protein AB2B38_012200 [Balneola sp. MJW-20]|uniref:hypothetical protein n=1 Tax=Gracilimonas aurantiaca TaxID=3234185 RepID=UPI0034663F66